MSTSPVPACGVPAPVGGQRRLADGGHFDPDGAVIGNGPVNGVHQGKPVPGRVDELDLRAVRTGHQIGNGGTAHSAIPVVAGMGLEQPVYGIDVMRSGQCRVDPVPEITEVFHVAGMGKIEPVRSIDTDQRFGVVPAEPAADIFA